ncbi:DP-EP family protein [Lacimicrobium sp. SS2-24]|uniref:DP-EP family protein n=1 Tax=Lacimicrobium sp. SS2-24 TaxID=2005569 RepID=UPI000B4AE643|nr:DP-EP family protein [Lacimicrobium sp. SS2-24]
MTTTSPIQFKVSVDITTTPPLFTIYDQQGHATDAPVDVTQLNTPVTYTLQDNQDNLNFVTPEITGDKYGNLDPTISSDGQTLTLMDSDNDNETLCVRLVVVQGDTHAPRYVSQDPQIRNRPPA